MAESNCKKIILHQPDNAVAFRAILSNIFKSIADFVSEEKFEECLSFLKSNRKKTSIIHKLHKAMVNDLCESLNVELEEILADGHLSDGLGKLRELITASSHDSGYIAWRPPGDVLQHLRSHDAEKIHEEHERLRVVVEELEAENNILTEKIAEKRKAVKKINDRTNRALKTGFHVLPHMEQTSDCMQKYIEILYK